MAIAPLQFVLIGMKGPEQRTEVANALRSLNERGNIRVLDVAYVTKQPDGSLVPGRYTTMTDDERKQLGHLAGALIGYGYGSAYGGKDGAREGAKVGGEMGVDQLIATFAQEDFGESVQDVREHIMQLAEDMPPGATGALVLIEHRWVLRFKDELQKAGIVVLGSGLIRPRSLVMFGAHIAEAEQAAAAQ
jgi:hypothetical protein